ncbi:MAG TPA: hypothetical protein V6D29_07580 [Leptolyngbyaceae cyanobacterium]
MTTLAPHQIVYLQKGNSRLYAETIQIVTDRQLCWARPLVLIMLPDESYSTFAGEDLSLLPPGAVDLLVDGPDILWPLDQFSPALDTEALPVLMLLQDSKQKATDFPRTHERLHQFIQQYWH